MKKLLSTVLAAVVIIAAIPTPIKAEDVDLKAYLTGLGFEQLSEPDTLYLEDEAVSNVTVKNPVEIDNFALVIESFEPVAIYADVSVDDKHLDYLAVLPVYDDESWVYNSATDMYSTMISIQGTYARKVGCDILSEGSSTVFVTPYGTPTGSETDILSPTYKTVSASKVSDDYYVPLGIKSVKKGHHTIKCTDIDTDVKSGLLYKAPVSGTYTFEFSDLSASTSTALLSLNRVYGSVRFAIASDFKSGWSKNVFDMYWLDGALHDPTLDSAAEKHATSYTVKAYLRKGGTYLIESNINAEEDLSEYTYNLIIREPVYINKTSVNLKKGKSTTLKLENANPDVTWSSSNKKVATVSKGKVTAKKKGTCTITAKCNGKKYSCKIKVK